MPFLATMFGIKQVYPGRYEPPMLLKLVTQEDVTFSHCVPSILRMVVTAPGIDQFDLSNWKVIIGGARLPKGLAQDAMELGIKVYAGYGLSETAPVLTVANLKPFMEADWSAEEQLDWAISTGFPVPLVDLKVVDNAGEEIAHDGRQTGEIVVRGPWLTEGYYKDPERTLELWEGGWMHTGDVATVDEYGYVQIVDRLKDIIKSGGEWIVSLELENLLSLHKGVLEAGVIGVPDEKWGERPLAVVVPREEYQGKLTTAALKNHLQTFVDDGVITDWSVPDDYVFAEELPKTSVGKSDKKVLRSKYGNV
jgi:fatty-acyl-CoA synthase